MSNMNNMNVTINLNINEIHKMLAIFNTQPYGEIVELIDKVKLQIAPQLMNQTSMDTNKNA